MTLPGRFDSVLSNYRFILCFDYCSFTGVDSVSLQVKSLLYVHGFVMMSPLGYFAISRQIQVILYLLGQIHLQNPSYMISLI